MALGGLSSGGTIVKMARVELVEVERMEVRERRVGKLLRKKDFI
jgi:hypothetical protein